MIFVLVCLAMVGVFIGGFFLLNRFNGLMKNIFWKTYGEDEARQEVLIVSEDEELKKQGQFAYDDLLEEQDPQK